jgi:hypothetical protein
MLDIDTENQISSGLLLRLLDTTDAVGVVSLPANVDRLIDMPSD